MGLLTLVPPHGSPLSAYLPLADALAAHGSPCGELLLLCAQKPRKLRTYLRWHRFRCRRDDASDFLQRWEEVLTVEDQTRLTTPLRLAWRIRRALGEPVVFDRDALMFWMITRWTPIWLDAVPELAPYAAGLRGAPGWDEVVNAAQNAQRAADVHLRDVGGGIEHNWFMVDDVHRKAGYGGIYIPTPLKKPPKQIPYYLCLTAVSDAAGITAPDAIQTAIQRAQTEVQAWLLNEISAPFLQENTPALTIPKDARPPRKPKPVPFSSGLCCMGNAAAGRCTCFTPVLEPAPKEPIPGLPVVVRTSLCGDCACRPDSPERVAEATGESAGLRSSWAGIQNLARTGQGFYCHDGMPRVVAERHPDGTKRSVDTDHAYAPHILNGIPYRADGTPAQVCAGWAALARSHGHDVEALLRPAPQPPEEV